MPAFEIKDLKQMALLWEATGKYDPYGQPIVSSNPVEIRVRWLNKYREILLPTGDTIAYDVQVITNQYVPVGSVLWLGGFKDVAGTSGTPGTNFHLVKTSNSTPDIKGRNVRYELQLMRLKDKLPTFG